MDLSIAFPMQNLGIFEFNSSGWSLKKGQLVDRVNVHFNFNKLLKNQNSLAEFVDQSSPTFLSKHDTKSCSSKGDIDYSQEAVGC